MAVVTIIKYFLAIAFAYILYMLLGLVVYKTRYENPQWDGMPTNVLAFGDQVYGIWILFILIIIAVVGVTALNHADRSRASQ